MRTLLIKESPKLFYLLCILSLYKRKLVILMLIIMYMYRFPNRKLKDIRNNTIISPCDGTIKNIEERDGVVDIQVYLSLLDVHVQWSPIEGRVNYVKYKEGEFNPAYFFEKSKYNEQVETQISNNRYTIKIRQIAGQIARRITNNLKTNQDVNMGDYIGMIKFSSRVDISIKSNLGENILLNVKKGDSIRGILTKLVI